MSLQIKDILAALNKLAPFDLAEKWDNVGLLVGNPESSTTKILIGLDPTLSIIEEAIQRGANTVITHHPVIFHPLPAIATNTPSGKLLEMTLNHKINIIACHTNFDSAADGVNDALAKVLGLDECTPLSPNNSEKHPKTGLGRLCSYSRGISKDDFTKRLFKALELPALQVAGSMPETIYKVALLGGSGSDFAELALNAGADVYLSAEIKHATARWAEEAGLCVVDGTHYATEKPAIQHISSQLKTLAEEKGWTMEIMESETERPPFTYILQNT
jgi:dinuclear metal center YbgI/SA1388 family protein